MTNKSSNLYNKFVFAFAALTVLYFGYEWLIKDAVSNSKVSSVAESESATNNVIVETTEIALKIYGNGWFGCNSEQKYRELAAAKMATDTADFRSRVFNALQAGECVTFFEGETVLAQNEGADGIVAVHKKADTVIYWTDANAVKNLMK